MPDSTESPADSRSQSEELPGKRSFTSGPGRQFRILGLVVAALAVGGVYWFATRNEVSTDDAFVDGNAVLIAPKVAGTVLTLAVDDNQAVRRGDLLLALDPRDYQAAADTARAALANAEAQAAMARENLALIKATTAATLEQAQAGTEFARAALAQAEAQAAAAEAAATRARLDEARYQKLVGNDFASRQRFEQAQADARATAAQLRAARDGIRVAQGQLGQAQGRLDQALTGPQQIAVQEAQVKSSEAQVEAARAALVQAELNLSYTRLLAPADGVVTRRRVNAGDQVDKNQNLLALVVGQPWVIANFKETQLTRMRPGQPVDIAIDAYPGRSFKGHVDSIQRGTGARFALLPPENATGNFVKVVQRVPVKIVFDGAPDPRLALALGMSVIPTVNVGVDPGQRE